MGKQTTPVSTPVSIPKNQPNRVPKGGKKPSLPKIVPAKKS